MKHLWEKSALFCNGDDDDDNDDDNNNNAIWWGMSFKLLYQISDLHLCTYDKKINFQVQFQTLGKNYYKTQDCNKSAVHVFLLQTNAVGIYFYLQLRYLLRTLLRT